MQLKCFEEIANQLQDNWFSSLYKDRKNNNVSMNNCEIKKSMLFKYK